MSDGCGCRSPRALRSCGCGWPGRSRTRSSRCGQSPWWPMGDGSGWPLPPLSPSVTIWTRGVWPGWTSASSIPTHWSQDRRVYWCQVGRSGPRATCTYATSRPAARGWRGVPPSLDSGGRGGGAVTGSACDVRRRAIAAVSTRPTMRPPSRRSPLLYDSRWGPCWLATPSTSPATMWAECRTCACGNGDAPTLHRPYETRPNAPASSCGWWTSAVPPPPVRPAGNAFQSQGAVASPVRTSSSKATAIL